MAYLPHRRTPLALCMFMVLGSVATGCSLAFDRFHPRARDASVAHDAAADSDDASASADSSTTSDGATRHDDAGMVDAGGPLPVAPVCEGCLIQGMCIAEGAHDPNNDCMSCKHAKNAKGYAPVSVGATCVPSDPYAIFPTCNATSVCGTPYCSVRDCWTTMATNQSQCAVGGSVVACPGLAGSASCASTPGCGQDAQYPDTAPRTFTSTTVGGDALVVDSHTKLTWQGTVTDCVSGQRKCLFGDASQYCWNLEYGGATDWRVPTIEELLDLIEPGQLSPATLFPGLGSDTDLWSSTGLANDATKAWMITYQYAGNLNAWDKTQSTVGVRCVRGPQITRNAAERFLVRTSQLEDRVLDRSTGLEWQRTTVPRTSGKSWLDALAHCESLSYAGQTDWRLPDFHELLSLLDFTRDNPLSSLPGATATDELWSSSYATLPGSNADAALPVGFSGGSPITPFLPTTDMLYGVRCVRTP